MLSLRRPTPRNGVTKSGEVQAFRSFVVTQSSRNVGHACTCTALGMLFSIFKAMSCVGATPTSVFVAALPVCAYAAASVALKCRPAGQEVYMMGILCFRAAYGWSMSAGFLPVTPWVKYCLHLHMDKVTEIVTSGLLEPAPLSFLVPVRLLLGVVHGDVYKLVGMPHPKLQGALVHAAGLLVALLVDWHYRCLYQVYKDRHLSKSKAVLAKAALAEEPPLDTPAAKQAFHAPFLRESSTAVAGYAGEAVCTQASIGRSHAPHALVAMLEESLSPWKSRRVQQERLKRGSQMTARRLRRCHYKSKSAPTDRVAIQLIGDVSPDDLPMDAPKGLAHIVEERLGVGCVAGMAIRAGCVVVCFDVCKFASEGQQPSRDVQEVRVLAMEATQEWRQELGLCTPGDKGAEALISVVTCLSSVTGQPNSDVVTLCNIKACCPVLVLPPKKTTHAIQDKNSSLNEEQHMPSRQGDQTHKPPASAVVHLPLVVDMTAPAKLGMVRGWHGPADSPEELEDKESSLCLLAAVQGCFVPLDVLRVKSTRVELCINLPADMAATITRCTSVELELWAGGKLACSSTVLLVPASRALVAAELKLWTQELPAAEAASFVKDLAHWLYLRQNCCPPNTSRTPFVQQLAAVGKGLLLHSLCCGMMGIAGMLLESLVQPPLGLTFAALASEAFAYKPEFVGNPLQESGQADTGADGSHITAQDLVAAARRSGNAAVLAQCQVWEAPWAEAVPISGGPAPPTRPAAPICLTAPVHPAAPICLTAPIRPAAVTLWQRFVMVLPLWPLARWVCTKTSAAFSAAGSRSSGIRGATARSGRAAEIEEYRAWVIYHTAPFTKAYFMFAPVHLSILFLKSARENQLDTDMPALAFLTSTYLFMALGVHQCPKYTEIFAVVAFLGRLITLLSLGSGLLPIPSSFSVVYKCRTEAILEVLVVSCLEPVRIPLLIPLRILLAGGYTALYAKSSFTHPLLEALAVNGASLLVSMVMDRRHRYIYAWHRANTDGAGAGTGSLSSAMTSAARCSIEMHIGGDVKIRKSTSEQR